MQKFILTTPEELEKMILKCLGKTPAKAPGKKKPAEDDDADFEDFEEETEDEDTDGFGEDDEEAEDEVTREMASTLLASLVKKKKEKQVIAAFTAVKCKPSLSKVPDAKLKPFYDKLKSIK